MKKHLVAVLVLFVVAGSAMAQGKISFGVGADVALPITSGFSNTQSIGKVYYPLQDMITLTGTAGYMTFAGKDFTAGTVTVKAGSWSMIPVLVGGRYYFTPVGSSMRWYGMFDMGLIFGSYTVPGFANPLAGFPGQPATIGGGSVSTSDFSYQPGVGFEASKWDIAVRFLGVAGAASIAARIGYMF
jgi:hypothetical protein